MCLASGNHFIVANLKTHKFVQKLNDKREDILQRGASVTLQNFQKNRGVIYTSDQTQPTMWIGVKCKMKANMKDMYNMFLDKKSMSIALIFYQEFPPTSVEVPSDVLFARFRLVEAVMNLKDHEYFSYEGVVKRVSTEKSTTHSRKKIK